MTLEITNGKDIFSKLKSSSSAVAYDGLLEIRSSVTKTKAGYKILRENEVLKDLVDFLHRPNEKILDVTLSILGNCCLDSGCRNEVASHGIVGPLVSILSNIARDSIQCRACRLIGNLAQEPCIAELLHKERIMAPIVAGLDMKCNSSVSTRHMAVRALRMLWSVEHQREKMLSCQAVRAVALLLPGNWDKIGEQELLKAVVKALATFTNHRSEECAQQVQGNGSGYQHLVSLVVNDSLKYLALACICNLCHTSSSRPALGNVGVVKVIIRELSNHQQGDTGLYTEMVQALCYLCRESVNRAKIRRAGGLPLMLKIIRNSSTASLWSFVLHALVQYVYDEISLQELLREGLVTVLVNKITDFVKHNGKVHRRSSVRPEPQKDSRKTSNYTDNLDSTSESNKLHSPALRSCFRSSSLSDTSTNNADRESEASRRRFRANSPSYQAVVQEQGYSARCTSVSWNSDGICARHRIEPSPDILICCSSPDYYTMGDWSPGSPSSMCFSPDASPPQRSLWTASPSIASTSEGLSPPSSPPPLYSAVIDDIDCPEVYSPICYDPADDEEEEEEENDCKVNDEEDCIRSQDTSEDNNSDHQGTKSGSLSPNSKQQDSVVDNNKLYDGELDAALILLSRVSHMDIPVEELAAHSTLTALLDYVTLIRDPQPRASRTLFRIIRNQHYFMLLLLQKFVLTVQSRLCQPQHSTCWHCSEFKSFGTSLLSQITMFAHSGFGEGELAYHLLKGEESVRKLLVVSIPYIVRIHRILWKLMVECDALNTLMHILENESDDGLRKYVPTSLKLLAAVLDIPNPYDRSEGTHSHDDKYPDGMGFDSIIIPGDTKASNDAVFLLLDDGSSVQVSKTYLSLQSPMFEAMFRGGFKESSEDYVPLPGISHYCLINLLRIMGLGHVPSCIPDIDLSTSLELVAVLDRFLIPGSEQLTEMIVAKFLSCGTAVDIYARCIEAGDVSHFHSLRYDTVRFILASNVAHGKTEKLFQDFLQSPYKKQVLTDITHILQESLNNVPCSPSIFASQVKPNKLI